MNHKLIIALSLIFIGSLSAQEFNDSVDLFCKSVRENPIILSKGISGVRLVDTEMIQTIWVFQNKKKVLLKDTFDIDYDYNFRLINIPKHEENLIILEAVGEYVSAYHLYLLNADKIHSIGVLKILSNCKKCDVHNYPIKNIVVKANEESIEFSFLSDYSTYEYTTGGLRVKDK